ncbi:MAG: effector binding domain-containing protein [Oscillospiraceae bacterium]|nr:effector binding domain-containing protein [Oscillospiraceae bacterium]
MENLTISQVSKLYDVTPRMLRHYEKLGLIEAVHKEDYAYRMYDEAAVRRLQQIIVLRKLRIPLKHIAIILNDGSKLHALQIMRDNIAELDGEISSLEKIRGILKAFVERLDKSVQQKSRIDLLDDTELKEVVSTLCLPKSVLKENASMAELNKADEILNKNLNVRIVLLPPFTVASNHYIGENPEEHVDDDVIKFIQESKLYEIKPDSRMFGFNHPNPGVREDGLYGYEVWVTIPDDMEVPEPLVKKRFEGGLFAVHTIKFPEFQYWNELGKWAENNDIYEPDWSEQGFGNMGGCLEEHLNWVYSSHMGWPENGIDGQLDLMLPIKRRQK